MLGGNRLDVPKAPKLLGSLVGLALAEGALPAGKLSDLYEKVEDTETRRQGVAEALLFAKVCPFASVCAGGHALHLLFSGLQMPCETQRETMDLVCAGQGR